MTNEEALEILEAGRNPYHNIDTDTWCEAFSMAIEALKDKVYIIHMSARGAGRSYFYERMEKLNERD